MSLYHHYGTSATSYCDIGENFNCDIVNRSTYSTVAGVPVALIGIAGYLAVLALATVYRGTGRGSGNVGDRFAGGSGLCALPYVHRRFCPGGVVHFVPVVTGFDFQHRRAVIDCCGCIASGGSTDSHGRNHIISNLRQRNSLDLAGELRLHELQSRIFRNTRMLRVWLPPGYSAPENQGRHYPVFYLNDGQNLFDPATAYIGVDWQADEAADRLIREGRIPPLIIVGIDNAQKDRAREYLPYRSFQSACHAAPGQALSRFSVERGDAVSSISSTASRAARKIRAGRIISGRDHLVYTAMDRPGIFGRLLLESPSLFISNRQLLKSSRAFRQWPDRIFMAMGTRGGGK